MDEKQEYSLLDKYGERKYLNSEERLRIYNKLELLEPEQKYFCLVIYWTGARISEALNICPRHIDLSDKTIVIRCLKKRSILKYRRILVPPVFLEELSEFVQEIPKDKCIWTFSRRTASRYIKKLMMLAEVEGTKACARGMRHGFAVNCVMNSVPLPTIKKWMGHATLEVTMIYTQIIGKEEREFAQRTWQSTLG